MDHTWTTDNEADSGLAGQIPIRRRSLTSEEALGMRNASHIYPVRRPAPTYAALCSFLNATNRIPASMHACATSMTGMPIKPKMILTSWCKRVRAMSCDPDREDGDDDMVCVVVRGGAMLPEEVLERGSGYWIAISALAGRRRRASRQGAATDS